MLTWNRDMLTFLKLRLQQLNLRMLCSQPCFRSIQFHLQYIYIYIKRERARER